MAKKNTTESSSSHTNLEKKSIRELLTGINKEDQQVPKLIAKQIPQIEKLVNVIVKQLKKGGRLFYIGAGTSGRLGIVDASEIPPTFGLDHGIVIGIIAGGDQAIRKAVEFAEDDAEQGWKDLEKYEINSNDVVIGIAASGKTPYVIGALKACKKNKIVTGGITCNPESELEKTARICIVIPTGAEFVTGSTRMKAGTAQKLVLNMISTSVMIRLGKVKGNKMVDMQLTNNKLIKRGVQMLMDELKIIQLEAEELLKKYGSVRKALQAKK